MRKDLIAFLSLLALSLLCYAAILPTYFLSDDFSLIGRVATEGMLSTWGKSHGGFLRPVTGLSYLIDFHLWHFNQFGFHLTNVLFHAINAFFVFLLFRRLYQLFLMREGGTLAFLTACLFLVLPSHTESVSWISGRTDVLATTFGLAATVSFVHLLSGRSTLLMYLSILCVALALLAKECAVVVPIVWIILFLAYIVLSRRRPAPHAPLAIAGALVCLAAYFTLRRFAIGHFIGGYGTQKHLSLLNAGTLNNVYIFAVRTFLPAMTVRIFKIVTSKPAFLISGFITGAVVCTLLVQRIHLHSKRWIEVATLALSLILCAGVSLVPVLSMWFSLFDTQSERFFYLPSVFTSGLAVLVASIVARSRRGTVILMTVLIVLETVALQWVNRRWIAASRLTERIAGEVAEMNPRDVFILNVPDNIGGAYVFRNGLTEAATTFLGRPKGDRYRVISFHSINSLEETFDAHVGDNSVHLALPPSLQFYEIQDQGLEVIREGNMLVVKNLNVALPENRSLVSFRGGLEVPMFRAIAWGAE